MNQATKGIFILFDGEVLNYNNVFGRDSTANSKQFPWLVNALTVFPNGTAGTNGSPIKVTIQGTVDVDIIVGTFLANTPTSYVFSEPTALGSILFTGGAAAATAQLIVYTVSS